jgi:hypothetical protein
MLKGVSEVIGIMIKVVLIDKILLFSGKYKLTVEVGCWQLYSFRVIDFHNGFGGVAQTLPCFIPEVHAYLTITFDFKGLIDVDRSMVGGDNQFETQLPCLLNDFD